MNDNQCSIDRHCSVLQKKAMLVTLKIHCMGNSKVDRDATNTTNQWYQATNDAGEYRKNLLAIDALSPIKYIDGLARKYHYNNTSPWLDDGTRLLASKHFLEYTSTMRNFRNKREAAVDEFLKNYIQYTTDSIKRLGGMYKPHDYLSVDEASRRFGFEVDVRPVPQAEDFRVDIGNKELEQIRDELIEDNRKAQQLIMNDLWQRLYTPVNKLVNVLSEPDKKFMPSTIENLINLVELLPKLNITDDPDLEAMRCEVENKLCGVDIYALRNVPEVRIDTAAEAAKIIEQMVGYMGEPPK